MNDGVFCALAIDFADAAQRAAFLEAPLLPHRATLSKAEIEVEESELFGGDLSVAAKSLKEALAKLAENGIEVEKRDVARWEKVGGASGPTIAIATKGELARDATAKDLVAWMKKQAKNGEGCYVVSDAKKRLGVVAYLAGYDAFCFVEEALVLAVASAGALGAKGSVGFWADAGLTDEAVYRGFSSNAGEIARDRFDEPQNLRDEDVAAFRARYAIDFEAIEKAHASWLDEHVDKKRAGMSGYVRADGSFAIEPKYPALSTIHEGLVAFRNDKRRWGYLDERGAEVIAAQFIEAHVFKEGRARVLNDLGNEKLANGGQRIHWRYGFVDRAGAFVVPPTFEKAEDFFDGRALVLRGGKFGYIDEKGDERIPVTLDHATSFACGRGLACVGDRSKGGKWGFLDIEGAWAIAPKLEGAGPFSENVAPFFEGGRWGLIDLEGDVVLSPRMHEIAFAKGGRLIARLDGGQGVVTVRGDVVVPAEFRSVTERGEMYEALLPDMSRAWFDLEGRRIGGDARFAAAEMASEGLVPVRREGRGKWEYVDLRGETVIAPAFTAAFAFGQGRAIVVDERGIGIIDREGKVVARPALKTQVRAATRFGTSGLAAIDSFTIALVALDGRVVVGSSLSGYYGLDDPLVWVQFKKDD